MRQQGATFERCLGIPSWQEQLGYFYAMEFVEGETVDSFIKRSWLPGGETGDGDCHRGRRRLSRGPRRRWVTSLSKSAISEVGEFAGIPEFASPEQFTGVG